MRTTVIVQARLTSKRLPGKVLAEINGQPMLQHVLDRASRIRGVDAVCLTIPDTGPNQALSDAAKGYYICTGPEHDVLERYRIAAEITNAERIVRITADCPLLDPAVADAVIALHDMDLAVRYVSNVWPHRTWPDGLDVEVFTHAALDAACTVESALGTDARNGHGPAYVREHVTGLMRSEDAPCLTSAVNLGHLKWSVDTPRELQFVREVMTRLPHGNYRMLDTMEAIRRAGLWECQPISEDWERSQ